MNTCGTCRFWPAPTEGEWYDFNLRPCGAIKQREKLDFVKDERGDNVMDDRYREVPVTIPKAMAVDGSGYYAALKTAEDFGCVLWEPKPLT